MKIVHIAPSAPYNDYWGYQDNLLPKYHKKLGHDVTMITTNTMHKGGEIVETDCADYVLDDGVRVIRLKRKNLHHPLLTGVASKLEVKALLDDIRPDFIFFHGLVSTTIYDVIKYKKNNPQCVVVQDNHLDYNNSKNHANTLKKKVLRILRRRMNRDSIRFVSKVYGVTPWRKQYAEDFFKIPPDKTDVLVMGADDEKLDFENRTSIRANIREKYNITDNDFLIVTGGKIDKDKNIHVLMDACRNIDGVKLLVFGQIKDDIKERFEEILSSSDNIISIGWIDSDKVYDYFFASDLIFFPGTHSVLWEQACASKTPCLFKRWDGMEHVNNGGNADFVFPITVDTLTEKIEGLKYTEKYFDMKRVAESKATDMFLYSNIAKKSLEMANNSEF